MMHVCMMYLCMMHLCIMQDLARNLSKVSIASAQYTQTWQDQVVLVSQWNAMQGMYILFVKALKHLPYLSLTHPSMRFRGQNTLI